MSASRIARRAALTFAAVAIAILGCRDSNTDLTGLRRPGAVSHDLLNEDGTVNVNVDVQGYAGLWGVDNSSELGSDARTVTLAPGTHHFFIAGTSAFITGASPAFDFDVNADGSVTVSSPFTGLATGFFGQLRLNPRDVSVDPNSYAGSWHFVNVSTPVSGSGTVKLFLGLQFQLDIGDEHKLGVNVEDDGNVSLPDNPDQATSGASYIQLTTVPVVVKPGEYGGHYQPLEGAAWLQGEQTVRYVRGLGYTVHVGSVGTFGIDVAADGTVSTASSAAATDQNTLTLNHATVTIATSVATASWSLDQATVSMTGTATVSLVPGVSYRFTGSETGFALAAPCATSPDRVVIDAVTYVLGCGGAPPANRPPVANAGGPYTGIEGSTITLDGGQSRDEDAGDEANLTYSWEFGDGTHAGNGRTTTHTYADNGSYTVTLTVTDPSRASSSTTTTVTVSNVPPSATFLVSAGTVIEGSSFSLSLSGAADPSPADVEAGFLYAFDCGDGSGYGAFSAAPSANCLTGDNGTRAVHGMVRDKDGGVRSYDAGVQVLNAAPVLGAIAAPADPVQAGSPVTVSASFTDAGTRDTHSATIDWDANGSSLVLGASVTETSGSGSVQATHTYTTPGVYTIKVTVTDDDGASVETRYQYVVIYDPAAGYVIGAGWIDSPLAACRLTAQCTGAKGPAFFGFVSKYVRGMSVPSGITAFCFHAGSFSFFSMDYEWMVVNGTRARYFGHGSVNGNTGYDFMLTAIDGATWGRWNGGTDRFRIKIWNAATGQVVYDNQMGKAEDGDDATTLSGGSIVIRR